MTLMLHELKQNRLSLIIWSAVLSFMLGVTVVVYPQMAAEMGELNDMLGNMGGFSDAFGMGQLNFGVFMDYFGLECSNTLGLGGALFAAIVGISAISKEEREHTAEFLLTHPISRTRVVTEKLLSVLVRILFMNLAVLAVSFLCILAIRAEADFGKILLIFTVYFFLQVEIAAITFGISAFARRGSMAIGLGIALGFYFMNLISNLAKELAFFKYITPFGYTDSGRILQEGSVPLKYLLPGILLTAVGILGAYFKYRKKDIL